LYGHLLGDDIDFPQTTFQMIFDKALQYIAYKQGDQTSIYTVKINSTKNLMRQYIRQDIGIDLSRVAHLITPAATTALPGTGGVVPSGPLPLEGLLLPNFVQEIKKCPVKLVRAIQIAGVPGVREDDYFAPGDSFMQ